MDKRLIAERFAKARGTYDREARVQQQVAEKMMRLVLQHSGTHPDRFRRVVEFGCGTGSYSAILLHTLKPDTLLLNDLCPEMEKCVENLLVESRISGKEQTIGNGLVRFVAGDAEELEFPSGTDLMTSCSTLQWFNDPAAFFARSHRFLRPGGILAFTTFGPSKHARNPEPDGSRTGLPAPGRSTAAGRIAFRCPLRRRGSGVPPLCRPDGRPPSPEADRRHRHRETDVDARTPPGLQRRLYPPVRTGRRKCHLDLSPHLYHRSKQNLMNTQHIYFVSGIDTDAGKSYCTAWLAKELTDEGHRVITQKFIQTGNVGHSEDIDLHRRLMGTGYLPEDREGLTMPEIFSYPCSPHLAARIDGRPINFDKIERATLELARRYDRVLVEGAGGLMVPLTEDFLTIDYVAQKHYPLVFVTSGKLGSINHTLLSFEAIQRRGIVLDTVLYNLYPPVEDTTIQEDTQGYIRRYLAKHFPGTRFLTVPAIR